MEESEFSDQIYTENGAEEDDETEDLIWSEQEIDAISALFDRHGKYFIH